MPALRKVVFSLYVVFVLAAGWRAVAQSGPVAAYGLNEGSGASTADATPSGNLGTITGAAWTPSGKYGAALSFDGVNDWVTVADANSLDLTTAVTLEAWVYPTASTGYRTVLLKETPGGLSYALYVEAGHANLYVQTTNGYAGL